MFLGIIKLRDFYYFQNGWYVMRYKIFTIEIVAVLYVAVFLTCVLIITPIVGVADNGDFERIMSTTGLDYLTEDYEERYFNFINREFLMTTPFMKGVGYFSTEVPLVFIAKLISRIVFIGKGIFDIRLLAMLYCCMFLLFVYFITKYNKGSVPIVNYFSVILTMLVFTDLGYISYFNSLYGEALSFTSLLLLVALAVYISKSHNPPVSLLIGFYVSAVLLTGAKAQNAPIGLIVALFSLLLLRIKDGKMWRRTIAVCTSLLVITSVLSYFSIPGVMRVCNKYQSIFYGVLKNSQSPQSDLEELGLGKEYAELAGTNYFMEEYPIDIKEPLFLKEINRRVSPFKVGLFYLKHPKRYIEKLEITADKAFNLIQGFGNYEKSSYGTRKEVGYFRMWNDFKERVLPHSLLFVLLFFMTYGGILFYQYIKAQKSSEKLYFGVFILVMLIGIIQFIVPVICDGEADLSKHLFLFNVCFDIMFIYMVVWLMERVVALGRKVWNS